PYRISHYTSPKYRALWSPARQYLVNLANAANEGVLNPIMPGTADYAVALDRAFKSAYAGTVPKNSLDSPTGEWNTLKSRLCTSSTRTAYREFHNLPGSSAKNTIAA